MVTLYQFIPTKQLRLIRQFTRGEEGEFFKGKLRELHEAIAGMPKTGDTEGLPSRLVPVTLHYFSGGSDWWIIERDCENDQLQAFGYACLNGDTDNAEFGYINIKELMQYDIELDLYWNPKPIAEVIDTLRRR